MSSPTTSEPETVDASKLAPSFSPTEQEVFHEEDRRAVGAIVTIMVTIFMAAVIGYSCVGYVASCSP